MNEATSNAGQDAITSEWVTLQNNHEQYERSALLIKLVAMIGFAISMAWSYWPREGASLPGSFFLVLLFVQCVLWLQEGILRTSQTRLAERLLRIEAMQRSPDTEEARAALQLHSEWQASRAGTLGLLGEYARNALRPTVAFPYAVLTASLGVLAFCH